MPPARRSGALIIAGQTAFAVLLVIADLNTPVGWPMSAFLVIVVAAAMWLPGVRPIWVSAVVCAVITVVTASEIVGRPARRRGRESARARRPRSLRAPHRAPALSWLGIALDDAANEANAPLISARSSRVAVAVEPTNEEWIAASHARPFVREAAATRSNTP